jgi:protein TonB
MTYMNPNEGTTITIPELTNTVIQLTEIIPNELQPQESQPKIKLKCGYSSNKVL